MKWICLTGGMGMGKSTAADWLCQNGVPLVDSDDIARQLVEPGQPALAEIQAEFGRHLLDSAGRLQRAELARLVFADPSARRLLEDILHPRIQAVWRQTAAQWRGENRALGVAVIPLLFETQGEAQFDAVVCVACSPATQRMRLLSRGWTELEMERRIQAQMSIERKMAGANYVVWNESGLDLLRAQMARIFSPWLRRQPEV